MFSDRLALLTLLVVAGVFVCVAAYWDVREKRIPNRLTLPMFFAGWIYQFVLSCLDGWQHLGSGLAGFAIGFGILFLLWFVGSGGGGDVKLMGALGVWLGGWTTILVLMTTLLIILGVMLFRRIFPSGHGPQSLSDHSRVSDQQTKQIYQKADRRLMTFAGPVAIATWGVLLASPWLDSMQSSKNSPRAAVVQQFQE